MSVFSNSSTARCFGRTARAGVTARPYHAAMSETPTWELVLAEARRLTRTGTTEFTLAQIISGVQRVDPSRGRGSISPIVQGMTANAGKGPPAACGKVLVRVQHGVYRLRQPDEASVVPSHSTRPAATLRRGRPEVQTQLRELAEGFDEYVDRYDRQFPFVRSGQYEQHRRTIDRRLELGSVELAIGNDEFCHSLHETLQLWGIGRRGSHLVDLATFRRRLRDAHDDLCALESLSIEDPALDVAAVAARIDGIITEIGVVENKARIVAGTKTLHHLVPELVPPMDRAWTGLFFGWNTVDPQNRQTAIFTEAFTGLAHVAAQVQPSRLVGGGWRTSTSKLLDNALIGWCIARDSPAPTR